MDLFRPTVSHLSRRIHPSAFPARSPLAHSFARRSTLHSSPLLGLLAAIPLTVSQSPDPDFPLYIQAPVLSPQDRPTVLRLVGLGVRTVSFLRVRVYNLGVYVEKEAIEGNGRVWRLDGWQDYDPQRLLTAPPATSAKDLAAPSTGPPQGEALVSAMLEPSQHVAVALRIVPTRPTDFSHLRDGLHRALLARVNIVRKAGLLPESTEEAIQSPLFSFKSLFPSSSVPKGVPLTLHRRGRDGALLLEYGDSPSTSLLTSPKLEDDGRKPKVEHRVLGALEGEGTEWISRQMVLAYFADKNPISAAAKEAVAKGFAELKEGAKPHVV